MSFSILSTIRQAAHAHKTLIIEYQPKDGSTYEQREIEPFSFRPEGTTDRLMAWDVDKQGVRSFLMENIRSARMTEHTFIPKYPIEL
ncbi:WYL domain-containing protein [Candidatus Peregrinibacteria bacterium]|nr:WYL domain-containing protein [Candidatus Peregrinibacteria bacterium]